MPYLPIKINSFTTKTHINFSDSRKCSQLYCDNFSHRKKLNILLPYYCLFFLYNFLQCNFLFLPILLLSYLLEHFKIICTYSFVTEKNSNEPLNIITQISSIEILDEPPCCVRQCRTSFPFYILGVVALIFNFTSSLHNTSSSSGSLFFTYLGGIISIVHYISKFITDQIMYTYIVYLLHNCTIT